MNILRPDTTSPKARFGSAKHPPLTLRLPFWRADRCFRVERVLAAEEIPWAKAFPLVEAFALSGPEERFVRTLMRRKRNLWVYRCNQSAFCGDFVIVDMSPAVALRMACVLELKREGPLKVFEKGGGVQMKNAAAATAEIARCDRVFEPQAPQLATGGEAALLAWLGAGL